MISVVLVEDQPDLRQAFTHLLENADGFHFSGAFSTAGAALKGIPKLRPEVVLMDINLPDQPGIECVRQLKIEMPALEIIMLSVLTDDESIFQSLQAGASGYLTKDVFPKKLFEAIQDVTKGHAPMSGRIARRVVQYFNGVKNKPDYGLTKTEKRILDMLCTGKSYKAIGENLFVSVNTVKFHLKSVYSKLQVSSRAEAILKMKGRY